MIRAILNPHAGYLARHGIDHVQALISAAVPDVRIHVPAAGDDLGIRCRGCSRVAPLWLGRLWDAA